MNTPSLPDVPALRAFFLRELHVALLNRFVHVFSAAALLTGIAPLFADTGSTAGETAPYFLIQAILYLVPLFALLIGAGSAQSDQEERVFLFSQPAGRGASVIGKFLALWLLIGLVALLLVLPSAVGDSALAPLGFLWLHAVGVGGVFLCLGLASGFSTNDRVKAHLAALCIWLLFLAGFDLVALAAVHVPSIQQTPSLWAALLMANPLDSFRVGALLSVGRVPFDASQAPALARWWLSHLGVCFSMVSAFWMAAGLGWSGFRLERTEA